MILLTFEGLGQLQTHTQTHRHTHTHTRARLFTSLLVGVAGKNPKP